MSDKDTKTLSWKTHLFEKIRPDWREEIDDYEKALLLRREGRMDEKVFMETRLRRGAYGQRYDNGRRHDGTASRELPLPEREVRKGPDTLWHAPGMQRIKIPFGRLTARQLEVLADLAEEYSDGICHVTTRQDIQLHYVHIEDTPDIMRRLAAVGVTTREACGNTVRNVTACPRAGICRDAPFDVTPAAHALAFYLLGHPDTQNFGRKFKVSFSGCSEHACGLAFMHDLGIVAAVREQEGRIEEGFHVYAGGGLGPVPYQAKLLEEFLPPEELLPTAQAVGRIFARLGEKRDRSRARLKFLVDRLGIDEFRRLVKEEREGLTEDERWKDWSGAREAASEEPLKAPGEFPDPDPNSDFGRWISSNVYRQKQHGYAAVTVALPLGDITARQCRLLADIVRKYTKETLRLTVEQNIFLRWISASDLESLFHDLQSAGLAETGAETIEDVTACPGTDTCKLGIASSRGLAAELGRRLRKRGSGFDEIIGSLRIKISGCFNSCGQHHLADIGYYGTNRKVSGYSVPHFRVVLGGHWKENGSAYGLAVGAVPSRRIPETTERLLEKYRERRREGESFRDYVFRVGKTTITKDLEDLLTVPPHDVDPSFYVDWADAREFTIGDLGHGECAGDVVSAVDFGLAEAERIVFDAQVTLDSGDFRKAGKLAYRAMITTARALLRLPLPDIGTNPDEIVREFRSHFIEPGRFNLNFAKYLIGFHEAAGETSTPEHAHQRIEEAQLLIEAAHRAHQDHLEREAAAKRRPVTKGAS
ncbi:MAG: nitrite/sulfite reductase [Candidatus Hydrogenedentota bacterium]|nr:MAG: nitrite/sulfite reductase [Candidatus Hydrogenedentota bacterium]